MDQLKKITRKVNTKEAIDLIPFGINHSDFRCFLFLLRMQISLEEKRQHLSTLRNPKEINECMAELLACKEFYQNYLSAFN